MLVECGPSLPPINLPTHLRQLQFRSLLQQTVGLVMGNSCDRGSAEAWGIPRNHPDKTDVRQAHQLVSWHAYLEQGARLRRCFRRAFEMNSSATSALAQGPPGTDQNPRNKSEDPIPDLQACSLDPAESARHYEWRLPLALPGCRTIYTPKRKSRRASQGRAGRLLRLGSQSRTRRRCCRTATDIAVPMPRQRLRAAFISRSRTNWDLGQV